MKDERKEGEDYTTKKPEPNAGAQPLPDEAINRGDGRATETNREQLMQLITPPEQDKDN